MNEGLAMTFQRLVLSSFCLGVLAACGGPGDAWEQEELLLSTSKAAEQSDPPVEDDGWPMQGTHLHGSPLTSASFGGAVLNNVPLENLHLEKGELVASVPLRVSGSTASFQACTAPTTGLTRACGLSSMGAGSCTPGQSVTVGGGACGLGSCTGDPVLRVCEGTTPCEHASPSRLVSGNDACASQCPSVQFACPASGVYNVLAGPNVSGTGWSMKLVASSGELPGTQVVRGTALQGALLTTELGGQPTTVLIAEVVNASQVKGPAGTAWDGQGETFLYHLVKPVAAGQQEVCEANANNPNWRWAVPISGLFDATSGARSEDTSHFTFGCDSAVIAKCYRWGYKPWLPTQDATKPAMMKQLHAACTRMARADYCGNGESFTMEGTPIHPWDKLPAAIRPLGEGAATPLFEAGWHGGGAVCLSKLRWQQLKPLPESCPLVAPGWLVPGAEGVACPPGQRWDATLNKPCATVCDSAEEAQAYSPSLRLFNESQYN